MPTEYAEHGLCIRLSIGLFQCCCGPVGRRYRSIAARRTAARRAAGECGQCHVVSVRIAAEHWLVFKKFSGNRGICRFLTYGNGTIMERWQFVFTARAMLMRHMLSLAVRQIVCMSVRLSVRQKSLFYGAMALDCTPVRYDCWSNYQLPNDF